MIDPRQLKDAVEFLEMKTRIRYKEREWYYGFCYFIEEGPVFRYFFFPQTRVKK